MPTPKPMLCGSISARPSPLGTAMHNAGYRALDLPFVYVAFSIDNPQEAVLAMRYLGIRGFAVSMPHKIAIMPYLDTIDETAAKIGAVNTIVNDDGHLTGYNTDWVGAVHALEEKVDLSGKRSVVVGAGGAARAIVYGLVERGSHVTIFNRTPESGAALARNFGAAFGGGLAELASAGEYDVLVNATSVGFHASEASIVPASMLQAGSTVLDAVFLPPQTKLLRDAGARGCITVQGTRMLVHQALFQFELYTGVAAPLEVMEEALLATIGEL